MLSTSALFLLSRLTETSSLAQVMPALMLQSAGMGIFYSPSSSSILSAVERERYGVLVGFLVEPPPRPSGCTTTARACANGVQGITKNRIHRRVLQAVSVGNGEILPDAHR